MIPPSPSQVRRIVVAGIGSADRHDDAAGVLVAERVAVVSGIGDIGPVGEPLDLLGRWDDADLCVVIDTVRSGDALGTVTCIEIDEHPGDEAAVGRGATSTHGIGLVGALRIARAVHHAPRRVVIVAIEGADFGFGIGLSPAVEAAVTTATDRVIELVGTAGDV